MATNLGLSDFHWILGTYTSGHLVTDELEKAFLYIGSSPRSRILTCTTACLPPSVSSSNLNPLSVPHDRTRLISFIDRLDLVLSQLQ